MKKTIALLICSIIASYSYSTVYYASPNGTGSGSSADNAGNLTTLLGKLNAGDILYLLEGQYNLQKTSINKSISGTAAKPITICNAPGVEPRTPILDFRTQAYGERGLQFNQGNDYFIVRGLTLRYSGKNALYNDGSHNTFENLDVYGNGDTGVQMKNGSDNQIINVDSHDNFDYQLDKSGNLTACDFGGNADGFADKQYTGGANTYIGCRSWNNSDDGWDFFQRVTSGSTPTKIINCICYKNGPAEYDMRNHPRYNTDKAWFDKFKTPRDVIDADGNTITVSLEHYPNLGNGNGFKIGGGYTNNNVQLENCLAVANTVKGFDQNNNYGQMTVYNCSAYLNGIDYGFHNNGGGTLLIRNCLTYKTQSANMFTCQSVTQDHNSWNISGLSVSDNDFLSLDTALILAPRNSEGDLAETFFMRLTENSKLIDAGIDVGLPYAGKAPDLGCYEYGSDNLTYPPTLVLIEGNIQQSVRQNSSIQPLTLQWGGGADDVEYTELPTGISASKNPTDKTITFSGTPTNIGQQTFTVSTISDKDEKSITLTIIVKPEGIGYSVAYVTTPDDERDKLIVNRLYHDPYIDLTVCNANSTINTSEYDLIVISPVPNSSAAGVSALKNIEKPTVLLKPFMLKNGVWSWGDPQNTQETSIKVIDNTHPLFTNITLGSDNTLQLFSQGGANSVVRMNSWTSCVVNTIATPISASGDVIATAPAGTNMNGTVINSDMIMIGISESNTINLTDQALHLIQNACRYILGIDLNADMFTGIENNNTEDNYHQNNKLIFHNNQLLILHNNQLYTLTGQLYN